MNSQPFWKKSFYCNSSDDEWCNNCRVCRYMELKEEFEIIALPPGTTMKRDRVVEEFWNRILPLYREELQP